MTTTITLEFIGEPRLKELEHELKQISGLTVFLVEPRDEAAPVLLSIAIGKHGEQAEMAIRRITHTIYDFLHSSAQQVSQQSVTLVTIEGDSVNIAPLSSDEIRQIIANAYAGQDC